MRKTKCACGSATFDTLERTPSGSTTALVFFDVDHFKELNDQHGHPAGDEVLRRIVQALQSMSVQIPDGPQDARVSISAGVASRTLRTLEDRQRLLRDADIALYQAKGEGRNCVRTSAN